MILNPFPELLIYQSFAPLLLRVVIALIFIEFAVHKFTKGKEKKADFFEKIGLKPGSLYVKIFALLELVIGILLLIGLHTQFAGILAALILLGTAIIKYRKPESLPGDLRYYVVLLVVVISLIVTGAGIHALDTPL